MSVSNGSINEKGLIYNLTKSGFTHFHCLCELIADSIDAGSNKVKFVIDENFIKIIDYGYGMNSDKISNMFDLYRQNHTDDKSMGISGLGGKAATFILSKHRNVVINTFDGENYSTINVPWDSIKENGKYVDMIKSKEMEPDVRVEFVLERSVNVNENYTGTTIVFPYDEEIHQEIIKNFTNLKRYLPINERFDVIFGKFSNVEIILDDKTNP